MDTLLLLLAYVLIDAVAQGRLTLLMRQYVPPAKQPTVNGILHVLCPLLYALYSVAVGGTDWPGYLLAFAVRLAAFDPMLNYTKGDPAFAVGSSALTDKLLRWLSPRWPDRVSAVVRVGALVLTLGLLLSSCRAGKPEPEGLQLPRVKIENQPTDSARPVSAKKGLIGWLKPGAKNPSRGKMKLKHVTIQQTVINGNGNHVGQAAPKAGPQAVGAGATAAEKHKPVEKTRTITKTITKTTPGWLLVGLFALGFAVRQFGPWVLRLLVPGLLARPG